MKDNMNQELEKCKNDVVYFAENYLNVNLQDYQKEMLNRLEKSDRIILNRRNNYFEYVQFLNQMQNM